MPNRLRDLFKLDGVPRCRAKCPQCRRNCLKDDDHSGTIHACTKGHRF